MNKNSIYVIQIVISVIIVVSVLLQSRGSGGLSATFGGTGSGGEFYRSRRGIQKFLYYETIVMAFLFAGFAIAAVLAK